MFRFLLPIRLIAVLYAARLALPLPAQTGPYSFMHYGTEQGLSNDFITCITRDRQGFLWIGTTSGLNRFDGRRFRVFRQQRDSLAASVLPGDYIVGCTAGPDGWLWISTNRGLIRLDPQRLAAEPVLFAEKSDTAANHRIVSAVAFDRQGLAWFMEGPVLYRLDPQSGALSRFKTTFGPKSAQRVYIDPHNTVWLTIDSRLYRFDPDTGGCFPYYSDTERTRPLVVLDLAADCNKDLWMITWTDGIYRYQRQSDKLERVFGKIILTRRMLPDTTAGGRPFFWIGGGGSGLALFFPDQQIVQDLRNDKRDPYTHNGAPATWLYKDERSGEVWIGTEVGLEQYAPAAVRFGRAIIPEERDFGPYNLVSGVVPDRSDTSGQHYFVGVWANSLFRWNRREGSFERLKKSAKFPIVSDEVFSIIADREGYVWIGMAGGISRYDPWRRQVRSWKMPFRKPQLANKILCSAQDRRGNLWFGANADGLFRFDALRGRPERVALPEPVLYPNGDLFVHALCADSLNCIWMATNLGLVRYDPRSGTAARVTLPGLSGNYDCTGIAVAPDGHIWTTSGNHLFELDDSGRALRILGPRQGIRCSRAFYIAADRRGKIWFNSDYLLHCFDPLSGAFTCYGQADGLFGNAPTDGLSITANGEIFIGYQNAFNYVDPLRLRRNTTPPPVVITSIRVLNRLRPLDEPLVLRPGDNMLSVEFAALNFSQPERNRYAYKLDGFDPGWNYTDRPVAIYTNLNGGQYTLRLKATNNDGVWNENGAVLTFRVVPPLHRRWYFYLGLALLGAGITYAIARYRYLQRRRLEDFRERLARDLHDEMGSTLSSIRFFSDFAQTQVASGSPQTLPVLQRISQSATSLSESMQDIIWAMKTRYDELDDIASRMTEFGLRLLEARGVRFVTEIDEHLPDKRLLPEQRRNLYLIFKEALNNAAKYAGCSEVKLIFRLEKNTLLLAIQDNGHGFDLHSEAAGNGLHNMRQRAAEIGGTLRISSAAATGTRVEFRTKI